jgi:Mo-dependent nitrogenase C-terminus
MLTHYRFTLPWQSAIAAQLDAIEIKNATMAHFYCRLIPAQCPFARDLRCFGRTILHIPPLCTLNPFYDQFISLRFKSLSYLADVCREDITAYC